MRGLGSKWVVWAAAGFALAAAVVGTQAAAAAARPPLQIGAPLGGEFVAHPASLESLGGQVQVLVVLAEPSAAEVFSQANVAAQGKSAARTAHAFALARNQFYAIEAAQQRVAAALASRAIGATEVYRVRRALNAISVYTTRDKLAAIRALPGVKAVHIVEKEYPTNSTSVPFVGAQQVWTDTLGLGKDLTGAGIKLGVIDTGIDYLHANFGGDGQASTYTNAAAATSNFTTLGGGFPSAKVVGGWDFAGDLYNGNNGPVPDPNPMDCGGHGSHVAGTAAGYGVTGANATFAGPYNTGVPFGSLKIGPGVAPLASLYALRVFGCGGSTGLTVAAIDWAMDPNNDGDMSDHLDVINMSLGSNFGHLSNTSALASEEAAAIGVVVVCSAGNSGDTFFIAGSPGNSGRTISTAAVGDPEPNFPFVSLLVNTPAAIAGNVAATASGFTNADNSVPPGPNNQTAAVLYPASNQNGCNAFGAGTFTGSFALLDRGVCSFYIKIQNAQAAGAVGVIIDNNAANAPLVTMGGAVAGPNLTVPSIFISLEDGAKLKGQLPSPGVNATFAVQSAADTLASFSSRGPRPDAPFFLKPDVAAPGLNITSTLTGWTCDGVTIKGCIWPTNVSGNRVNPNSQAGVLSGTSMASPHMAGTMALLRQLHPDWSVEELKALVMNTALHNVSTFPNGVGPRNGPDRVGTGREDVPLAAQNNVVAFNGDDAGAVSVSFGTEVIGTFNGTKTVRVDNKGATDQSYTLAIENVVDNPGVSFSVPPSVLVPAGQSVTFDVTMAANA
ncbi:MAG TPA: S8 family serine peptidase, partial [Thermoanaerobaculaceae bacterium]|nr:S8 family serine peptidase [Thermoanaerobaculaceae bacterium]